MMDQNLAKLKRSDLLELLVKFSEENEILIVEKESLQLQLQERTLSLREAGSIAEASLRLHHVFENAQQAADQYLENVKNLSGSAQAEADALLTATRRECALQEDAARQQCETMLTEAKQQCETMLAETQRQCESLLAALLEPPWLTEAAGLPASPPDPASPLCPVKSEA